MSDTCSICGTFDDRCTCSTIAGGDSAALPSSVEVAPSVAPTGIAPPGPVGATIAGEPGHPVPQAHPSYTDMSVAVQWCALMAASHGNPDHAHVHLALHAADTLRGMDGGAL